MNQFLSSRPHKGFTLVELMLTVAILGMLMMMTGYALRGLQPRAHLSSGAHEVAIALKGAKARAIAQNNPVWFGWFVPQDDTGRIQYAVFDEPADGFDPNDPTVGPGNLPRLLSSGRLNWRVRAANGQMFGDLADLPAPFQTVNPMSVDDSGCSFCDGTPPVGWIRFLPRGEIRLFPGDETDGAAIVMTSVPVAGEVAGNDVRFIAVTSPFGLVKVFSNQM